MNVGERFFTGAGIDDFAVVSRESVFDGDDGPSCTCDPGSSVIAWLDGPPPGPERLVNRNNAAVTAPLITNNPNSFFMNSPAQELT